MKPRPRPRPRSRPRFALLANGHGHAVRVSAQVPCNASPVHKICPRAATPSAAKPHKRLVLFPSVPLHYAPPAVTQGFLPGPEVSADEPNPRATRTETSPRSRTRVLGKHPFRNATEASLLASR